MTQQQRIRVSPSRIPLFSIFAEAPRLVAQGRPVSQWRTADRLARLGPFHQLPDKQIQTIIVRDFFDQSPVAVDDE
jgi:hypothetical protein